MSDRNFIMLIEYSDGLVKLCQTKDHYIIAREEDLSLLTDIGHRLIDDNLIVAYQLAELVGKPVRKLTLE